MFSISKMSEIDPMGGVWGQLSQKCLKCPMGGGLTRIGTLSKKFYLFSEASPYIVFMLSLKSITSRSNAKLRKVIFGCHEIIFEVVFEMIFKKS